MFQAHGMPEWEVRHSAEVLLLTHDNFNVSYPFKALILVRFQSTIKYINYLCILHYIFYIYLENMKKYSIPFILLQ